MRLARIYVAAIGLAAALPVLAADTSPDSALQVTSTSLQLFNSTAKLARVALVVTNVSSRTITGFSYSVLARYPDGSERTTGASVELVFPLMLDELRPLSGGAQIPSSIERLGPGQSKTLTTFVPLSGDGLAPVVTTKIVMVALDDNTALGDLKEIRRLQAGRLPYVEDMSSLVAELRRVRGSPSPKKAADDLVLSLSGPPSEGAHAPGRVAILRLASKLLDGPDGTQKLDQAITVYEALLASAKKYSSLTIDEKSQEPTELHMVAILDLRRVSPTRPYLVLPCARLRADVLLPVGSKEGTYDVTVSQANRLIHSAQAVTRIQSGITTLTVQMDLRRLAQGLYTFRVRRVGSSWQEYPLRVR
jgi:hypothetical protein